MFRCNIGIFGKDFPVKNNKVVVERFEQGLKVAT
jgi:hypothetical protein